MKARIAFIVLLMILTTSIVFVYAGVIISNVLTASSQATRPDLLIEWVNPVPTNVLVGETWDAVIKVTNNYGRALTGFRLVFNVTSPSTSLLSVVLEFGPAGAYPSRVSGSYVEGKIRFMTSSITINPGENVFLVRGRYNFAGNYNWEVAIIGEEPTWY